MHKLSSSSSSSMEQPFNIPVILSILSLTCFQFFTILALNQEGLYLQQVKRSLSDPAGSLSSWSHRDATPCNWTGITCSQQHHRGHGNNDGLRYPSVVSVNLSGSSLSGPFPVSLCRLSYLSIVSLYNNSINSSLPLTISLCQRLTYLDLSQNLLEGPIPHTLSDIPNLRYGMFTPSVCERLDEKCKMV